MVDSAPDAYLPNNLDAEAAVLGSILIDRQALDLAQEIIQKGDFHRLTHRLIWDAMCHLADRNEPIDMVSVGDVLVNRSQLDEIGGALYLYTLTDAPSTSANIVHYAKLVEEAALERQLMEVGQTIFNLARKTDTDVQERLTEAVDIVAGLTHRRSGKGYSKIDDLVSRELDRMEDAYSNPQTGHLTGTKTPLDDLDFFTCGFHAKDLVIIAGRPGSGKSSLAMQIAVTTARETGQIVAIHSLEMPELQLVQRMLACESKVSTTSLNRGIMGDDEWGAVGAASEGISGLKLRVDDDRDVSASDIRHRCKRLAATQGPISAVIVDHVQLVKGSGRAANRNEELGTITKTLRTLGADLNCVVILLSQLSRKVEERRPPIPQLSDLRESGQLEEHADVVLGIYRPGYYKAADGTGKDASTWENDAEIHVLKNRQGARGQVLCRFAPRFTCFDNKPYDPDEGEHF